MLIKTRAIRRLFIAAGLSAFAVCANAFILPVNPQITIDRAIDSPTLTVRYTGVSATLVELRINGTSVGTRSVTSSKNAGETNFTLNLGDLHEGDNEVAIRLFDRTGKVVAEDHTNIATAQAQHGPVSLTSPKTGATVQGPVEVKMALEQELKDCYVSFFVDGSFKSMTNFPPFTYMWDTERESNGWHELEAWAIDDASNTHKTGKVRIFVNNPHGDTRREGANINLTPTHVSNPLNLAGTAKPLKSNIVKIGAHSFSRAAADLKPLPAANPSISKEAVLGSAAGSKPMKPASGIAMGPRTMLPTGTRIVKAAPKSAAEHPMIASVKSHVDIVKNMPTRVAVTSAPKNSGPISNVTAASRLVSIARGTRLPNLSAFYIALDTDFVDFHGVLPRVDEGVPMTPLRFLLEKKGGKVDWDSPSKTVFAKADGNDLSVHIGDAFALVNRSNISLEKPSYLDRGRTIVPLTFLESALHVKIQYDKASSHVLITSQQK